MDIKQLRATGCSGSARDHRKRRRRKVCTRARMGYSSCSNSLPIRITLVGSSVAVHMHVRTRTEGTGEGCSRGAFGRVR
jgi:hypothetical protein